MTEFPRIVSVDDHVVEPAHVWERWLPARFRDRGPKVERRGIVKHAGLEGRDRRQALRLHAFPEASTQRCVRVGAKVESVPLEDAFEEQLDLQPFEIRVVRNRWAAKLRLPTQFRFLLCYRYSHTRIRLSNWSVSTGLVM